jgi:hypothetical protein
MAWGSNTNPVTIGDPTKKSGYDDLWDKLQYVRTDVVPANGKMLQGATTAWVGWTKDTDTWTDNSMIVFTTGAISAGGSVNGQSHYHTTSAHTHPLSTASNAPTTGSSLRLSNATSQSGGGANTGNSNAYYQLVIAATKDAYT